MAEKDKVITSGTLTNILKWGTPTVVIISGLLSLGYAASTTKADLQKTDAQALNRIEALEKSQMETRVLVTDFISKSDARTIANDNRFSDIFVRLERLTTIVERIDRKIP